MSGASKEYLDLWNRSMSRVKAAENALIRATQFLVRPMDGFPAYDVNEIRPLWEKWAQEKNEFLRIAVSNDVRVVPPFPKMPAIDAQECCFRMWGLLIQEQVDTAGGRTAYLRETALQIAANDSCKNHPESCPCHVPDHLWMYPEEMEALAPINPKHREVCYCAGYRRCKQKEATAAAAKSTYEYKHNVDTCPCGVCYKSRVDSGTEEAYVKRCEEATTAVIARLPAKAEKGRLQRQDAYHERAEVPTAQDLRLAHYGWPALPPSPIGISEAAANADAAIAKASAACGGAGTDHPDFAKNLFAAMGTPHDSKCPHGLHFYACMSCSH